MTYTLPESADDLLIKDGKLLMRSLSIYETLRRFEQIIRLTPFRFEDFAAALLANDQSALLAEAHIQLLKTLIREDRQQQTWLGPPDIRDSVNLYLHLTDHSNWPSALRIYLSADPRTNADIIALLSNDENKLYPFKAVIETRLTVLEHLCDQFLMSVLAREEIVNGCQSGGKHETTCRSCNKGNGDLIGCSNCVATYHLKCSDPPLEHYPDPESGDGPYVCPLCRANRLIGVTDCISEDEKAGNLKRHEPIAIDDSGRRYWFVVRRVFAVDESEDDVRYYTTTSQIENLLACLDNDQSQAEIYELLNSMKGEMMSQAQITENLQSSLLNSSKKEDGSDSMQLGQDGTHRCYTNHYITTASKIQPDKDIIRGLSNKFCMNSMNSFKWLGATDGSCVTITMTIKTTILKLETTIPSTFIHPCWQTQRSDWIKLVNDAREAKQYGEALTKLECCMKPILFKTAWFDTTGFLHLFRSTVAEREELKKIDRQPRGFERNEKVSADFEMCYRLGTFVKFSSKLKPVKHQVWKQKGEEYRLTGLNGWYWQSKTRRSRTIDKQKKIVKKDENGFEPVKLVVDQISTVKNSKLATKSNAVKATAINGFNLVAVDRSQQALLNRCKPKLRPFHDFHTKRGKVKSILVLPELELRKLARSAGLREVSSFSYTAKQNSYIWPYGMTPRPILRTCWLYRNQLLNSFQDAALQLKVLFACIRWDELAARPPASGRNTIVTDESTVTIELLKKREKLPYLTHTEYLIRKTTVPAELPEPKKRKSGGSSKQNNTCINSSLTPSRSGLRARRPVEKEEEKGPTREEIWVPEDQLELWELKQFDDRIERQNSLLRERALREEAERRRRLEEEKRRVAEQERRKVRAQEEAAKRARMMGTNTYSSSSAANNKTSGVNITPNQTHSVRPQARTTAQQSATPVLRYFRTEGGQIIRLPASYLQLGTPLILRHVNPGNPNQTNTYIIRPQAPAAVTTTSPATPIASTTVLATTATATPPATPTPKVNIAPVVEKTSPTTVTSGASAPTSSAELSMVSTQITGSASEPKLASNDTTSETVVVMTTTTTTTTTATNESVAESGPTKSPKLVEKKDDEPVVEPTMNGVDEADLGSASAETSQAAVKASSPAQPTPSLVLASGDSTSSANVALERHQPLIEQGHRQEEQHEQQEKSAVTTGTVGTASNEMAHDQRAPEAAATQQLRPDVKVE